MAAADGKRLLNYVLPVMRFLGMRRVRIPSDGLVEYGTGFAPSCVEPQALRPIPEGLWNRVVRAARLLATDLGIRDSFVLDVHTPGWCVEPTYPEEAEGELDAPRLAPLEPVQQPYPPDLGLSAFLAGVWYTREGCLILADWLEDQLGPCALATALRASRELPSPVGERVCYDAFRWRWLDPDVICYFSRRSAEVTLPRRKGTVRRTAGFVLGLLHRAAGKVTRRWARWLEERVARPLATEMGADLPEDEEPWVWL